MYMTFLRVAKRNTNRLLVLVSVRVGVPCMATLLLRAVQRNMHRLSCLRDVQTPVGRRSPQFAPPSPGNNTEDRSSDGSQCSHDDENDDCGHTVSKLTANTTAGEVFICVITVIVHEVASQNF
ncbi:hypothetical protein BXZ70DRAFT_912514 [Cristinia sonorae]|uniref:Uncharacterized protein n=1 Tax=Cristinia sonorae TaxID=1940300 RepID=A0A8K0UZ73_9AGAR|nr:hypothetical protein BXZ70DRAFT_912514 [Cristinia sonorae]